MYPIRNFGRPDSSQNLWSGFSDYPARSLCDGFPLNISVNVTTTQSSSAQPTIVTSALVLSCEAADDYCTTQHRFLFQRPFSSNFNTAVESSYLYGITQFGSLAHHHGVEILNPTGTPVLAVEDGIAIVADNDAHKANESCENFYGNLVVLEHHLPDIEGPVYTLYGHLATIKVQVGQIVSGGELIGEVGATGRAIGGHLHFEVRVGTNLYTNTRNPAL